MCLTARLQTHPRMNPHWSKCGGSRQGHRTVSLHHEAVSRRDTLPRERFSVPLFYFALAPNQPNSNPEL